MINKNYIEPGKKKPLKSRSMQIKGLGISPPVYTESGLPSVDIQALKMLAGDLKKGKYGLAYDHFL